MGLKRQVTQQSLAHCRVAVWTAGMGSGWSAGVVPPRDETVLLLLLMLQRSQFLTQQAHPDHPGDGAGPLRWWRDWIDH